MLKEIVDTLQEQYGESANVYYQKGNVYVDLPLERRGFYCSADGDLTTLLFRQIDKLEEGNKITLKGEEDKEIVFTFDQKEGVRSFSKLLSVNFNIGTEIVRSIINKNLK